MKVLAVLYKGLEAARQEPRLLGTVENQVRTALSRVAMGPDLLPQLGISSWLKSLGHEFIGAFASRAY